MVTTLVREMLDGHPYEYYPIGEHIVAAPGVCGGRPTFKYTRIDVRHVLRWLSAGQSVEELVARFEGALTDDAIEEAARLACRWPVGAFEDAYVPEAVAA